MKLLLGMVLLLTVGTTHAGIYKCIIDGSIVYQSSPCADGKEMSLEPPPPSAADSSRSLEEIKAKNKAISQRVEASILERKIRKLQDKNKRLERDIDGYRSKQKSELESTALSGRRNRFTQMSAINDYWDNRIAEAASKMKKNQRDIDKLEKKSRCFLNHQDNSRVDVFVVYD